MSSLCRRLILRYLKLNRCLTSRPDPAGAYTSESCLENLAAILLLADPNIARSRCRRDHADTTLRSRRDRSRRRVKSWPRSNDVMHRLAIHDRDTKSQSDTGRSFPVVGQGRPRSPMYSAQCDDDNHRQKQTRLHRRGAAEVETREHHNKSLAHDQDSKLSGARVRCTPVD